MELNAKIASLEDEVKLLKGEVKLILSEIRTAILGQSNPFATKDAFALGANPDSLQARPPIRVVKALSEDDGETGTGMEPEAEVTPLSWQEEEEEQEEEQLLQPMAEAPPPPPSPSISPPPRIRSVPASPAPRVAEAAPTVPELQPVATVQPVTTAPAGRPAIPVSYGVAPPQPGADAGTWSLVKIAGLAIWAEEALKQIGPERLQVLLDLCEYGGHLPSSAREALTKVMSLGLMIEERVTPPSLNECLVVLYQLDALMRGEEPLTVLRGQAAAG